MKNNILFLLALILVFISCDEDSTVVEVEKNKLFAKVIVSTHPSYFDLDSNFAIYKTTLDFEGELIGEEITSIESIFIGTENIPFIDSYSIDRKNYGVINFNRPSDIYIELSKSEKITIETGIGKIEGTFRLPDSVDNIIYNHNLKDTLASSDSLEISFEGNAEYYVLDYWITYAIPPDTQLIYHDPREIVSKTKKFIISSSDLSRNGTLGINRIESVNGPYLEEGSKGNMTGDGTGYLYSRINQSVYNYFYISK